MSIASLAYSCVLHSSKNSLKMPALFVVAFVAVYKLNKTFAEDISLDTFEKIFETPENYLFHILNETYSSWKNTYGSPQIIFSNQTNFTQPLKYSTRMPVVEIVVLSTNYLYSLDAKNVQMVRWITNTVLAKTRNVAIILSKSNYENLKNREIISLKNLQYFFSSTSLKLLTTISSRGVLTAINVIYYEESSLQLFSLTKINNFYTFLDIHKAYYLKGSGKQIIAHLPTADFKLKAEQSVSKSSTCLVSYGKLKYHLLVPAWYCYGKQMLLIELSEIYNISYKFTAKAEMPTEFTTSIINFNVEPWLSSSIYLRIYQHYKDNPIWLEGAYAQYYTGYIYIYCVDTRVARANAESEANYQVWVKPFSSTIWLGFLVSWISTSICFMLHFRLSDHKFLAINNVQTIAACVVDAFLLLIQVPVKIAKRKRLLYLVVFAGMLLTQAYVNTITSFCTVRDPEKRIETEVELFSKGFQRITMNTTICQQFTIPYECVQNLWLNADFTFVSKKMSWQEPGKWKNWYLAKISTAYQRKHGSHVTCNLVAEEKDVMPSYIVVYTINRYWIMETVQRVHEAGLIEYWDRMGESAEIYADTDTFVVKNGKQLTNVIKGKEIWTVFILSIILFVISFLLFLMEIMIKYRRKQMVSQQLA